ncbi:MAG: 4Fe-4S binding protein [Patescibacteria group bacterium]|nr:4Fe-4S binding protein [Patescibacteria group bacterium]
MKKDISKYEVEKSMCAGCGACVGACPYGAIKIGEDGKAVIDQKKCQKCGECADACPFDAIKKVAIKSNE